MVRPAQMGPDRSGYVTLVMKDFTFEPATVCLKAGEKVALTIKNEGAIEHDWSMGREVVDTRRKRGYRTDLWTLLKPEVSGRQVAVERANARPSYDTVWEGERAKMLSTEVDLEPGGSVTLRFTVPATARGTWKFGSFGLGQYGFGMRGTLAIDQDRGRSVGEGEGIMAHVAPECVVSRNQQQ